MSTINTLQSALRTMIVHGNPRAALKARITQPTSALDGTIRVVDTSAAIAKDVAEAFKNIPYIKPVAGVVLQIIKIREELKANTERCEEIIDVVCRHSIKLLRSLKRVSESSMEDELVDLNADLQDYQIILETVREALEPFTSQAFAALWVRFINRTNVTADLTKLERRICSFHQEFNLSRLTAIEVHVSQAVENVPVPVASYVPQTVPPSPLLVVGRSEMCASIVIDILQEALPRIAILGHGGIGKTTVATTVMHDPEITKARPRCLFVSCESLETADLVLAEIANVVGIPQSQHGPALRSLVVDNLRNHPNRTIICIDNFETPWEGKQRTSVEDLLAHLSGAGGNVVLIVTMRGTQCPAPSFIHWKAFHLQGLASDDAGTVFTSITSQALDDAASCMLEQLDGSPLAITLFAQLVMQGESPVSLLTRWKKKGTCVLELGGMDRLSRLDRSIQLSIESPQMDEDARQVLGLLAFLPSGLIDDPDRLDSFENCFGSSTDLHQSLRILIRTSLLHRHSESSGLVRLQMLSPIREYSLQRLPPLPETVASLVSYYINLLRQHRDYANPVHQSIVIPELRNIRSLLLLAPTLFPIPSNLATAASYYTGYTVWTNLRDPVVALTILQCTSVPAQLALVHLSLGNVYLRTSNMRQAETSVQHALELFDGADDCFGQAKAHLELGDLRRRQDRLGEAETSLQLGLELFIVAGGHHGQARTHESLGRLRLRQDRLHEAETSFHLALERFIGVEDRLGQANTHLSLGNLRLRQNRFDDTETSLQLASELYNVVENGLGQANTHKSLGDLRLRQDRLDEAETSLDCALHLYNVLERRLGQADTHKSLGDLRLRQARLDAAEFSFQLALERFIVVEDRLGQANTLLSLGDLRMRQNRLDEAKNALQRALELYSAVKNCLGQANTHKSFGDFRMRQNQLDRAENSFQLALERFIRVEDRLGQANTHESFGDLRMRQNRLDEAETSLQLASELYSMVEDCLGQANTQLSLGHLRMRQNRLDEAENALQRASELYSTVKNCLGQANTHKSLGRLRLLQDRLDEAENSFQLALERFIVVEDRLGQANAHWSLGDLRLCQDRLDEAETSLGLALELFIAVKNRLGQANTHNSFGYLRMRQNRLGEAETSLDCALELYDVLERRLSQANTLLALGDLRMRQDRLTKAETPLQLALELFIVVDDRLGQANAHGSLGDLRLRQNRLVEADLSLSHALPLHQEYCSHIAEAGDFILFGLLGRQQQRFADGARFIAAGWGVLEKLEGVANQGSAYCGLGDWLVGRGTHDVAKDAFVKALECYPAAQLPSEDQRRLINSLIKVQRDMGEIDGVREYEIMLDALE